jgi:hypothetical protein
VDDSVARAVASKKSRREREGRGGIGKPDNSESAANLPEKP